MKHNKWLHIIVKHCVKLKDNLINKINKNIDNSFSNIIPSLSSIFTFNPPNYFLKSILIFSNNHFIIFDSISDRLWIIFSKHIINSNYKFQCNENFQDVDYLIFFIYIQNENHFSNKRSKNLHQAQKWAYKSLPQGYFSGVYPFQKQEYIHCLFNLWVDKDMQNNGTCHSY